LHALIPHTISSIVRALNELLFIGVDLVKSGLIQLDALILLVDCASPKIHDKHKGRDGKSACQEQVCLAIRKLQSTRGISLTDEQLAKFLDHAMTHLGVGAITIAKHLLTSDDWGLALLGPLVIGKIQNVLTNRIPAK
jgi:hypothetical protein